MKRGGITLLWWGLVILLGLTGCVYFEMSKTLQSHIPNDAQQPEKYGLAPELIFTGDKKRRIAGWYFPLSSPKGGVVLVHGLGLPRGGKSQMLTHAKYLQDAGWASVAIDLYGFGDSDGAKIALGSDEWRDVAVGHKMLRLQPELKDKPVGLMGISMGGASVIIAAGKEQIGDFVISASAYPTIMHLLDRQLILRGYPREILYLPTYLASRMLIWPYNNAVDYIDDINVPVLLMHGKHDERVAFDQAVLMKNRAPEGTEFIEFDAGHDLHAEKPMEFQQHVLVFIRQFEEAE